MIKPLTEAEVDSLEAECNFLSSMIDHGDGTPAIREELAAITKKLNYNSRLEQFLAKGFVLLEGGKGKEHEEMTG